MDSTVHMDPHRTSDSNLGRPHGGSLYAMRPSSSGLEQKSTWEMLQRGPFLQTRQSADYCDGYTHDHFTFSRSVEATGLYREETWSVSDFHH